MMFKGERRPADATSGRWATSGLRILVVDDDAGIRESLRETLTDAGHGVRLAADGVEALRILRESAMPPDLLLLDLRMPRQSGWDVLAALRASPLLLQVPVVVISADHLATPSGAVAWLRKPVPSGLLLRTVSAQARRA